MTMTNATWELSAAFEQSNFEHRNHVAKLLDQWGGAGYNSWPERAEVGRLETPPMTASWFYQIASLGRVGIHRNIEGSKLPGVNWKQGATYDVWFCPILTGTNMTTAGQELGCYIVDWPNQQIVYLHLGCTHRSTSRVVRGQCTQHLCDVCGKRWEVDTGD